MDVTDETVETTDSGVHLALARGGDADAFCRLIEPLQTRLLRQATALSGDLATAEDLVSETLVEAWKSLARFNGDCRLSTWLYSILMHRHYKWLRRAKSRPLAFGWLPFFQRERAAAQQENLPSAASSPAEEMAQKDSCAHLLRCVDRLPARHREVVLLRFFEDASLPEIARILKCNEGTVKSRLHHALEKLRKMKMNEMPMGRDT